MKHPWRDIAFRLKRIGVYLVHGDVWMVRWHFDYVKWDVEKIING